MQTFFDFVFSCSTFFKKLSSYKNVCFTGTSSRNPARLTKPIITNPDELDDVDCYFPQDGYDYEKHMKRIDPRMFVPVSEENMPEPANDPIPRNADEAEIIEVL